MEIELPASDVFLTYIPEAGQQPKRARVTLVPDGLAAAYRNNSKQGFESINPFVGLLTSQFAPEPIK